jgi:hypothetical protein
VGRFIPSPVASYLPVYLWRHKNKSEGKDDFLELLRLMSVKQRAEDAEFDPTRVGIRFYLWILMDSFPAPPEGARSCSARLLLLWQRLRQQTKPVGPPAAVPGAAQVGAQVLLVRQGVPDGARPPHAQPSLPGEALDDYL